MKCSQQAFSLMEIVVVIAIIGIAAATMIPGMLKRTPKAEWPTILGELNDIVSFARQEAISSQTVHRINFKTYQNDQPATVTVEKELDDPEKPGKKKYEAVSQLYFKNDYKFHETIKLKAVYLGRENELENNKGEGHCYVVPDGLVQDISILLAQRKGDEGKEVEYTKTYKMVPFFGRFEMHDELIKPEK